jgi:hypothetical protein
VAKLSRFSILFGVIGALLQLLSVFVIYRIPFLLFGRFGIGFWAGSYSQRSLLGEGLGQLLGFGIAAFTYFVPLGLYSFTLLSIIQLGLVLILAVVSKSNSEHIFEHSERSVKLSNIGCIVVMSTVLVQRITTGAFLFFTCVYLNDYRHIYTFTLKETEMPSDIILFLILGVMSFVSTAIQIHFFIMSEVKICIPLVLMTMVGTMSAFLLIPFSVKGISPTSFSLAFICFSLIFDSTPLSIFLTKVHDPSLTIRLSVIRECIGPVIGVLFSSVLIMYQRLYVLEGRTSDSLFPIGGILLILYLIVFLMQLFL